MRKLFLLLAVILIVSPVFAQEDDDESVGVRRQFSVTMNPIPLFVSTWFGGFGIDFGAEFAPVSMFSIKANFRHMILDFGSINSFADANGGVKLSRMSVEGRLHPAGKYVQGFFLDGGFQFHRLTGRMYGDYYYEEDEYGNEISIPVSGSAKFDTYAIFLGLGVKNVFGSKRPAFAMEYTFNYAMPLPTSSSFMGYVGGYSAEAFAAMLAGWAVGARGFRFNMQWGIAF